MTDTDDEFEQLVRDYRTLTPEQRERLVRRAIERAKSERAAMIRSLFRGLWDWIARRAAIADLQRYDDRMLRDIGIHRSEIEAAVNRPRCREMPKPASNSACCRHPAKTRAPIDGVRGRGGKAA